MVDNTSQFVFQMQLLDLQIGDRCKCVIRVNLDFTLVDDQALLEEWTVERQGLEFASFSANIDLKLLAQLQQLRLHLPKTFAQGLLIQTHDGHFDENSFDT